MRNRRHRQADKSTPDLTPMIDVTFMLLIFFLLCTKFVTPERGFDSQLPTNVGPSHVEPSPPADALAIHCLWDPETRACSYVIAIGARMRMAVPGGRATLEDILPLTGDDAATARHKRSNYSTVFDALVESLAKYEVAAGANVESYEISFAGDAARGAASGTAPWAFVTMAIDATSQRNKFRKKTKRAALPVNFKFSDALGRHSG